MACLGTQLGSLGMAVQARRVDGMVGPADGLALACGALEGTCHGKHVSKARDIFLRAI